MPETRNKSMSDEAYHAAEAASKKNLTIGKAVEALKAGQMIRRAGWNGKGMHVYMEDMWSFPIRDGIYAGQSRKYAPVMVLYIGAADTHQPGWNASTPDLLADDWEIVA